MVTSQDGTSAIITSGVDGKADLSTYPELIGKTITNIALKGTNADGDNTDYCDSLSVTTSYKVLPHQKIGTPVYNSATYTLSGLTPNANYVFTTSNGTKYYGTSSANGQIDLSLLNDASGVLIPGGSVLSTLLAKGDQKSTIDSVSESLSSPITLPLREKTPSSSYEEEDGLVTGLTPNSTYRFAYTKADGSIATLDVKSDANGQVAVLLYPSLDQATITGIQKAPSSSSRLISSPEVVSYLVGSESALLSRIKARQKSALEKAVADKIAASGVTDPDAVKERMTAIIAASEQEIDTLPYTSTESFTEQIKAISEKLDDECDYEISRESTKEKVRDLKRTCNDDPRVNAVIEKAVRQLDQITFEKDSVSSMSDIYASTKVEVQLTTAKENAESTMVEGDDVSQNDWTGADHALYDTYTAKIDAATSESEITSLVNQYQSEKTTLRAQEAQTRSNTYSIWGYVIFGVYALFFALYFFIFRGTITDIGIKSTRLIDAGGNVKIVSNSEIASVINLSKELSVAVVEIPLAYEEDIQRVEAVIAKALPEIQKALPAIKEGPYYKGVSVLDDSVVQVKFVAKCKEEDVYQLQRDLNRAFLLLFYDNHIECKPYDRVVVNDPDEDYEKATKAQEKTANQFAKDQAEASKGIEPVNK